jgi:hypothetical protein
VSVPESCPVPCGEPEVATGPLAHAGRGLLFYGITPPRANTPPERCAQIAAATLARLQPLDLDALVLYDVDDEHGRTDVERPFPFMPMQDPVVFAGNHLGGWDRPMVVYRSVGKYRRADLEAWLHRVEAHRTLTVFAGAASAAHVGHTRLDQAYELHRRVRPELPLGGVLIAERHARREDEHLRMLAKQERGCSFFISQIFYDLDCTRNLLADYAVICRQRGIAPRPVILTTSPCGSTKTLEFMAWLGIRVPRWLEHVLRTSSDPLAESLDYCLTATRDVIRFCRRLGLPFGINVESLTNRRLEIEASVALAREVRSMLDRT